MIFAAASFAVLVMVAAAQTPTSDTASAPNDSLKAKLRVPEHYRATYQYLGNWAPAKDDGPGSDEFHTVYASPGTIEAYRKTGEFADGTVLVKEVFETATNVMTTGTVSRADRLIGWFVMVKDSANRYPNDPLWGEGWGWAWYNVGDPVNTPTKDFRAECLPCHQPARSTDWTFIEGYPALRGD
jgi:hypothetical protein